MKFKYSEIEYDEAKSQRNIELRGISFASAIDFVFNDEFIAEDKRRDYGEPRFVALGVIGSQIALHGFYSTC